MSTVSEMTPASVSEGARRATLHSGARGPLGEAHLRKLIREYMAHYHMEHPHQGLDGMLIQPADDPAADGPLVRRERLGGLLDYYYREAA